VFRRLTLIAASTQGAGFYIDRGCRYKEQNMRRFSKFAPCGFVILFAAIFATFQRAPVASGLDTYRVAQNSALAAQTEGEGESSFEQIRRGDYLTHSVAMCVVCHSPKDERGRPVAGQEFEGGIIPARPTYPKMASWAEQAPALGPLVGRASEEVIEFLKSGIVPRTGQPPRGPMPPFRLSDEDARAVVAYLRSLNK
jgi:mono/diheme cytochrome c family protein